MKRVLLPLIALGFCAGVLAKLPPLSPEAKAKADEAAAKTAWQAKVDGYRLCQVQDRVAAKYRESAAAAGKTLAPAVTTPPCTEDVLWLVLKTPEPVAKEQLVGFGTIYKNNVRPVQPVNSRVIKESR